MNVPNVVGVEDYPAAALLAHLQKAPNQTEFLGIPIERISSKQAQIEDGSVNTGITAPAASHCSAYFALCCRGYASKWVCKVVADFESYDLLHRFSALQNLLNKSAGRKAAARHVMAGMARQLVPVANKTVQVIEVELIPCRIRRVHKAERRIVSSACSETLENRATCGIGGPREVVKRECYDGAGLTQPSGLSV